MRFVVALILLATLAASCTRSVPPDAEVVEVTVSATLTVQPTLTPLPTMTPAPSTPVMLPAGWSTYELIGCPLVVAYPPSWEVEAEWVQQVVFTRDDLPFVMISVSYTTQELNPGVTIDDLVWTYDYDAQVNFLKQMDIAFNPLGGAAKFLGEGKLPTSAGQAYVRSEHQGGESDGQAFTTFVRGERWQDLAIVMAIQPIPDQDLPAEAEEAVSLIAQYASWKSANTTPGLVAPSPSPTVTPAIVKTGPTPTELEQLLDLEQQKYLDAIRPMNDFLADTDADLKRLAALIQDEKLMTVCETPLRTTDDVTAALYSVTAPEGFEGLDDLLGTLLFDWQQVLLAHEMFCRTPSKAQAMVLADRLDTYNADLLQLNELDALLKSQMQQ